MTKFGQSGTHGVGNTSPRHYPTELLRFIHLPVAVFALAALCAQAQEQAKSGGEADESGSKAAPSAKTTKEERHTARAERLKKTAAQRSAGEIQKGEADPAQSTAMHSTKATKEEKAKAREARLKKTAAENKAGQIPKGESQ